jgi:phosphoglycolate phosphatase
MPNKGKRFDEWPSAVVFDLDGTLVDSAGDLAASVNELLAAAQLTPLRVEEAIGFIGNGIAALVQQAFLARGVRLEADELSAYVARFKIIYEARATDLTYPFAGVPELISDLRMRGVAIGICTNKEQDLAQKVVDGVGLRDQFDAVVGGLPGRPAKPSPIPLLETIVSLGASAAEAIMVGDSAIDMLCARNANIPFIGVTFGYCRPPMSELSADITIGSFEEFEAACGFLRDRRS